MKISDELVETDYKSNIHRIKELFFFFENLNKIDSPWQTHQKKAKIEINKIKDKKYGYYMDSNEIKRKIREYLKNIFYQNLRIYKKRVIFFFF